MSILWWYRNLPNHMRQNRIFGITGRTCSNCRSHQIKPMQQHLTISGFKGKTQASWDSIVTAINAEVKPFMLQQVDQLTGKFIQIPVLLCHMFHMLLQRSSHADNTGNIFSASTHSTFLSTTIQQWNKFNTITNVKKADPFGAIELMSRSG